MKAPERISRLPVSRFFGSGMWTVRLSSLSPAHALGLKALRVVVLALRGFMKDDCQKTASILTYYSLLNIVPLFAMVFAVAKGFGLQEFIERRIVSMAESAKWQADITNQLLSFSGALLEQAKGGLIAGLGTIMIFYTVISILGKIEDSFNAIWSVHKARTWARKFSDYIAILVFAPVLFVMSGSISILVTGKVGAFIRSYAPPGMAVDVLFFLVSLLPYVSIWVLLMALYMVMPNTRVPVRSALIGGIAAGTVFHVVQWAYIRFQIGVASYGAIYGSFAALPLFLVWLQISWMVVLFGAELSRFASHYETFGFTPEYGGMSSASRKVLMVKVMRLLVSAFETGERPPAIARIAASLEIPVLLVERIVEDLISSGLAVEVAGTGKEGPAFLPARSIEHITVGDVFDAEERLGRAIPAPGPSEEGKAAPYGSDMAERDVRLKDL